jgi:hypothetical protein
MPRPLLLAAVALACFVQAPEAGAQQMADTTFHPQVARPAFAKRPVRVLFDEAHHNFHTVSGRYRAFAELLEKDRCVLTPGREQFSAERLAGFDILVIANAAGDDLESGTDSSVVLPAFTAAEAEAVHRWVEAGGGLLLIADHSPFGEAAAPFATRFGVDMGKGFVIDRSLALDGEGNPGIMQFTRERNALGDHVIMEGRDASERVAKLVAFTGQSLAGPKGAVPLMRLTSEALDLPWSAIQLMDNPDSMMRLARPATGRSVGIAFKLGRGRVVVLGEAAMLSAQVVQPQGGKPRKIGMNRPGIDNQQFALNVVRWLGGALADAKPATSGARIAAPTAAGAVKPPQPPTPATTAPSNLPNFGGTWKIATQETEAPRQRSAIGNHEEPVRITQTAARLSVEVQSDDPAGKFAYDLTGAVAKSVDLDAGELWTSSRWDGATLATQGRRLFTTPEGPRPFEFSEKRKFSADGERMSVETRIKMQPSDLVRTTEYARVR